MPSATETQILSEAIIIAIVSIVITFYAGALYAILSQLKDMQSNANNKFKVSLGQIKDIFSSQYIPDYAYKVCKDTMKNYKNLRRMLRTTRLEFIISVTMAVVLLGLFTLIIQSKSEILSLISLSVYIVLTVLVIIIWIMNWRSSEISILRFR